MNPIYRFFLKIGTGTPQQVFPVYGNDLTKDFARETSQMYFRAKLSGKLKFVRDDFDLINDAAFTSRFGLTIEISYDRGGTWAEYWAGYFYKTDCEFNANDKQCIVTPSVDDDYNALIENLEKEVDIIAAAPAMTPVKLWKRPIIQVYVPGQDVVGCVMNGMYWEQTCDVVDDTTALNNTYKMRRLKGKRLITTSGDLSLHFTLDSIPGDTEQYTEWSDEDTNYKFCMVTYGGGQYFYEIRTIDTDTPIYRSAALGTDRTGTFVLAEIDGTGNVIADISDLVVYARILFAIPRVQWGTGTPTYTDCEVLPVNDFTNNQNYGYALALGSGFSNLVVISNEHTNTPTEWGKYEDMYYSKEDYPHRDKMYPASRKAWAYLSIWVDIESFWDKPGIWSKNSKEYIIRDCYALDAVISAMFTQLGVNLTFAATDTYSKFLYGSSGIKTDGTRLFITPKSNMLVGEYDSAARVAKITLKDIFDMLRDVYRCYYFVEDGKLRIEHVKWFMNGGDYDTTPGVGRDLTTEIVTRNGKQWAFDTEQYKYDKPDMTTRFEFGWMDEVTTPFTGYPIDCDSGFVNKEKIEEIKVNQFTTDVDYMQVSPSECSMDGFALFACNADTEQGWNLAVVPIVDYVNDITLQNGYVSFWYLQKTFYIYDMPTQNCSVNGDGLGVVGTKKYKTQEVQFPCLYDVDLYETIKTTLGDGEIEKISINLSSRNGKATLKYLAQPIV
jgi:hypothetical protein